MKNSKSICVFIHYFSADYIPLYVITYVRELQRHFDEILLVTNSRNIINEDEIKTPDLSIKKVRNEGYDMGMFYKGFNMLDLNKYKTIACINDSNVLFGKLDLVFNWANTQNMDFWGLMDSHATPPFSTHTNNYHIQSHFIVFNQTAFPHLQEYLNKTDLSDFVNNNIKEIRKKVINHWEIGLSQYLLSKNLLCSSFFNSNECQKKYNKPRDLNISLELYDKVIQDSVPIIKKKIINSVKVNNFSKDKNWKRLIKRYGDTNWNLDEIINELILLKRRYLKYKLFKPLKKETENTYNNFH